MVIPTNPNLHLYLFIINLNLIIMKGTLINDYISKNGNLTQRYAVSGTQDELEEFDLAQGSNLKIDEETGDRVYHTIYGGAKEVIIGISQKSGKVYIDTMAAKRKLAEARQHGVEAEYKQALAMSILTGKSIDVCFAETLGAPKSATVADEETPFLEEAIDTNDDPSINDNLEQS
jgi:hypothetical protein